MGEEARKLEWMYEGKNSSIDREAYLLGKRINNPTGDKGDFIVKNESDKKFDEDILQRLDYESKMREDPLISIRKNEQQRRRELLNNPVRCKRLQSNLVNALKGDLMKQSKKSKHRRRSSSSSSSDQHRQSSSRARRKNHSSKDLMKKAEKSSDKVRNSLKMALESQLGNLSSDSADSSSDSSSSDDSRRRKRKIRRKSPTRSRRDRSSEKSSSSRKKFISKPGKYGLLVKQDSDDDNEVAVKSSYKKVDLSNVKKRNDIIVHKRHKPQGFTKKLSAAELEKKRQEMMQNADWRDKSRKTNVKKYAIEDKLDASREEKLRQARTKEREKYGTEKSFLHDVKLKQTTSGSLEDTVRRKKHSFTKRTDYTM